MCLMDKLLAIIEQCLPGAAPKVIAPVTLGLAGLVYEFVQYIPIGDRPTPALVGLLLRLLLPGAVLLAGTVALIISFVRQISKIKKEQTIDLNLTPRLGKIEDKLDGLEKKTHKPLPTGKFFN